jgi:hypothetical protein
MDNFMTVVSNGIPFHARLVKKGEKYGLNRCITHDGNEPLVEFYDARFVKGFESLGQFVSRYYVNTILGTSEFSFNDCRKGLCLDGGVRAWNIDGDGMKKVIDWLEWITAER